MYFRFFIFFLQIVFFSPGQSSLCFHGLNIEQLQTVVPQGKKRRHSMDYRITSLFTGSRSSTLVNGEKHEYWKQFLKKSMYEIIETIQPVYTVHVYSCIQYMIKHLTSSTFNKSDAACCH